MTKNELWNKFAGKKILMIRNDGTCETNVVVGCDPDIGICFARIGEEHQPWWVIRGRLDPRIQQLLSNNRIDFSSLVFSDDFISDVFDQLRSGYISEKVLDDLWVNLTGIGPGSEAICPYSA